MIEELGGLHAFSGWDGPILTDSGGFQVFSLRDTLLAVDDDGVTFRSVYDGAAERLTPESVADIQRRLGSDIAMCLDICPPAGATPDEHEQAVRRTSLWAERQAEAPRPGQLPLRDRAGRHRPGAAAPLDRGGIALAVRRLRAGWAGGRREPTRDVRRGRLVDAAPAGRSPRYFMGLRDPERILEVVARGIDMFDCVLPTRTARTGSALTAMGRLNLRNARFAVTRALLEEGCGCPACQRFSRAFVRHLVNQQEILGLRLLTLHNLWFVLRLTEGARAAILRGEFERYRADTLERLAGTSEEREGHGP